MSSPIGSWDLSASMTCVALPPSAVARDEHTLQLQLALDVSPPGKVQQALLEDAQRRLFTYVFPPSYPKVTLPRNAVDIPFFYSILHPAPMPASRSVQDYAQPMDLKPTLLPFQRRSVHFLLGHEGLGFSADGNLIPKPASSFSFWDKVTSGGRDFYLNRLSSAVSLTGPEDTNPALGAILAEEPGLGKTLETISLILLTRAKDAQRNPSQKRWDSEAKVDVRTVKTTLIVTPVTLAAQWCEELANHAPSLKVLVYDGWTNVPVPIFRKQSEYDRVHKLNGKPKKNATKAAAGPKQRVSKKDAAAKAAKTKATKKASKSATPVVDADAEYPQDFPEWVNSYDVVIVTYRVLASELARPRRQDVVYANVDRPRSPLVICEWSRVVMDEVQMVGGGKTEDMVSLIPRNASYAVSGTPARQQVSDLIHVLRFLRVDDVVGSSRLWNRLMLPAYAAHFTAFIQQYAVRTVKASVKDELTIPQQTRYVVPVEMGRVERHVYDEALDRILFELGLDSRGVAASEGWELDSSLLRTLQRQLGDKVVKAPLKSMEQGARETGKNTMDDRKSKILLLTRQAQLVQQLAGDPKRERKSLAVLEKALQAAESMQSGHCKGDELKKAYTDAQSEDEADESDAEAGPGEGKQRADSPSTEVSDDSDEAGIPKTPDGDAVHFLLGDINHSQAYAKADELRRTLLKKYLPETEARKAMEVLRKNEETQEIDDDDVPVIEVPYLEKGAPLQWRTHIKEILMKSFRAEEDADGGEYQRSLDEQPTHICWPTRGAMTNERTLLAAHDAKEAKQRKTKAAQQAIGAADDDRDDEEDEEILDQRDVIDLLPEHEVLQKTLSDERKTLYASMQGRSIKSIMTDIHAQGAKLPEKKPEKTDLQDAVARLRVLMKEQSWNWRTTSTPDLAHMRRAFNQRVMRFLTVSGAVEWEGMLDDALTSTDNELVQLDARINTNVARQAISGAPRQEGEEDEDEDEEACILCRCEFGCMKLWISKPEGKTCPVCRVPINPKSLQRFTVDDKKAPPPAQPSKNGEAAPQTRRRIEYNTIDPGTYKDIQAVECEGDYGHKIQTLIRHLLYIQLSDEGAKSIVFSAWADSLFILQNAMRENGIPCLRIDQADAANKFRTDPTMQVLLLHGERENAGLNVTCASRVFLLESVVHHGFEIQAIARIDRMGQTRSTEVYCYYAEDTIEKNILDLAAKRGLSLYTKANALGTVNVSFAGGDAPTSPRKKSKNKKDMKNQKGDYIMKTDDMLAILFPHMFEDLEYLLPEEAMGSVHETMEGEQEARGLPGGSGSGGSGTQQVNAVAGPSRLRE
ncbi:SNF2 family N-terminal domain-containing protein [Schizophyllum amplum]|uniref:SNF2 family N-terminal domain-containing protein n=1 Tax=Schizophyllum amplum TaxID=97359 RepID=A0A550C0D0_9AGAR|nr:SNF2 family N-terminal domain-containing protein [Auriculariopsis ampla]